MKRKFKRHKQILKTSKLINADIYYWTSSEWLIGATIFVIIPKADYNVYRAKVRKD